MFEKKKRAFYHVFHHLVTISSGVIGLSDSYTNPSFCHGYELSSINQWRVFIHVQIILLKFVLLRQK